MKYLLDTCIVISFFKNAGNVVSKIADIGRKNCLISEITLAELRFGAENSQRIDYHHKLIDEFIKGIDVIKINESINFFAKEKARLTKEGRIIPDFDLLIGTTAVSNNLILVTNNTKHFDRISKIKLEDWTK